MNIVEMNKNEMTLKDVIPGQTFHFKNEWTVYMKGYDYEGKEYLIDLDKGVVITKFTARNWDTVEIFEDATMILNPTDELKEELEID